MGGYKVSRGFCSRPYNHPPVVYFERENLSGHEHPFSSVSVKGYKIYKKLPYLI